jgi:hypothetical protein
VENQGRYQWRTANPEEIIRTGKKISDTEAQRIMTELQAGRDPFKTP